MERWIEFEEDQRLLIVRPNENTHLGLISIKIILDDSKTTSEYYWNLWITANPEDKEPT